MTYEELLEKAREIYESKDTPHVFKAWLLANIIGPADESEDERIRKELITHFRNTRCVTEEGAERIVKWIAWLEKQGEQKTLEMQGNQVIGEIIKNQKEMPGEFTKLVHENFWDLIKAEPKFKAGDWIVDDETPNDGFRVIEVLEEIYKVIDIDGDDYHIPHRKADGQFHLWTIADAKDGDVLVGKDGRPFIFTGEFDAQDDNPTAYCGINSNDKFITGKGSHWTFKDGIKPATKEQCDRLFAKMRESGYEWDADKKELKKMKVASKESEDRIRKALKQGFSEYGNSFTTFGGIKVEEILAWFEKQQPLDKKELANEFLRNVALSIINWLDANTLKDKMCLSNMEYEDIENAVCNADWMKIYRYMQKKLKGSLMINVDDAIDWLDYNICNAYDYDGNDVSSTLKEKFIKDFKL